MEGSDEARAVAKQTREMLSKRKREGDASTASTSKHVKVSGGAAADPLLESKKACTHKVAIPEGFDVSGIDLDEDVYGTLDAPSFDSKNYRKKYAYVLDPFQSTAVACLERNESVLVAAHTSAGKTVVAEYAIAYALQNNQRVVYTSPLKALSNQKFRELQEEFQDVGLMTGDVTINEDAGCVVMTTEILRSMLYRGSAIRREVSWVIFDEVHYMQDRERGVVWEETIINMPPNVRMVFLSATLSNALEFADWVASLHHQPCHVVFTDYRPTPLTHFAMPCVSGEKEESKGRLYMLCSKDGEFKTRLWEELEAAGHKDGKALESGPAPGKKKKGKSGRGSNGAEGSAPPAAAAAADGNAPTTTFKRPKRDTVAIGEKVVCLLRLASERKLLPMIVFSFARKECETFAMMSWTAGEKGKDLDFTTADEKEAISEVFENAISSLNEEDRDLSAIRNIKRYLMKGIGVHHGGLIPLVKELVEILFQESLVKVLFATETFAMGLNMPARAVVFTALSKFDGESTRFLTSGEYIQMSGRAGRRGKDDCGYCIMLIEDPDSFTPEVARAMVSGTAMPLLSRFKLSYYTLLNLTKRQEGGLQHMEYLIKHSFQQFQHEQSMPAWQQRLHEIEVIFQSPAAQGLTQEACEEYVELRNEMGACEKVVQEGITEPDACLPFLKAGRLVHVREGATDWGWGIVLQTAFVPPPRDEELSEVLNRQKDEEATLSRDNWQSVVLLSTNKASRERGEPVPVALDSPEAELAPIPVPLSLIVAIGTDRIEVPGDVRPASVRDSVLKNLSYYVFERNKGPTAISTLHPTKDMSVKSVPVKGALRRMAELTEKLKLNIIYQKEIGGEAGDQKTFEQFKDLAMEREALKEKIGRSELASFRDEVECRRNVLKKLGHLDSEGVLTVKGKAAAEVDTADELMSVELMFNAVWNKLDKHKLVALLSCLIPCFEKDEEQQGLPVELAEAVSSLQAFATEVATVTTECGLEIDVEKYILGFTPNLMVPLYKWSQGSTFQEVADLTSIYEGTLIRCARRLMELMGQLIYAADKVGETDMHQVLVDALATIQRGIMFSASLYL